MKALSLVFITALVAMGCQQQRFASVGPSDPVPAGIYPVPTPNPCPSMFSFEAGSPTNWSTTSWNFNLGGLVLDQAMGYCGTRSLKVTGNWGAGGDRNAYIQYEFPGAPGHYDMLAEGTEVHFRVYTSPAMPAGSNMSIVISRAAGCGLYCWTSPYVGTVGNPAGNSWVDVSADYGLMGYSGLNDVQQILLNVYLGGSLPWTGTIWIDEVNW